jgi:hypothetical protein
MQVVTAMLVFYLHSLSTYILLLRFILVFCVVFWFVCLRVVSYAQCCPYLFIVHSWLFLRFSLTFIIKDL